MGLWAISIWSSWCLQGDRWQSSAMLQENHVWHPQELCSSGRGSWHKWLCEGLGQGPKEGHISSHMKSTGEVCERYDGDGLEPLRWAKLLKDEKHWIKSVSVREGRTKLWDREGDITFCHFSFGGASVIQNSDTWGQEHLSTWGGLSWGCGCESQFRQILTGVFTGWEIRLIWVLKERPAFPNS